MTIHIITVKTRTGTAQVQLTDEGDGRPVLVLHGGAGPGSVAEFAARLVGTQAFRVITPTHPGFAGTARPDALTSMSALAEVYVALLDALDLTDVLVVGNSIGGWVAAEIAVLGSPRLGAIVLVDAVGLASTDDPIVDFFGLTMDEVAERSYVDPDRFRVDVAALPPAAAQLMAGNRAALLSYGGTTMADAALSGKLASISVPTLVVWGAADRIVAPSHGRVYADSIPGARLVIIDEAGHLPQLETPGRLVEEVMTFAGRQSDASADADDRPTRP